VPLNPLLTPPEVEAHLTTLPIRGVVVDGPTAPHLPPMPWKAWWGPNGFVFAGGEGSEVGPGLPLGPGVVGFSSGSTGTPKRVVRPERAIVAESAQFQATVGYRTDDVVLTAVPLFHAHGFSNGMIAAIRSGAHLVLLPQFQRGQALTAIERHGVSVLPGVPFMFEMLAKAPQMQRLDTSSLRLCFSAGASLGRTAYESFRAATGQPVRQLYGTSETGALTINLDDDIDASWETVGRGLEGVEVWIEPVDDGGDQPAVGEVVVRSASRGDRYLDAPDDPAFRPDGSFVTGDLGVIDDAGRLAITGRRKLYISTGGFKVDPIEVEAVLEEMPMVHEAIVVGVPRDAGEEVVKAVIVPEGDCSREQVIAHCRERLAPFKVPRTVEFRDEIPRNALGKVLRGKLIANR
jgi:long-chain acyl-CoA synthetase